MGRLTFEHNSEIDSMLSRLGNLIDKYAEGILIKAAEPIKEATAAKLGTHRNNGDLIDSIKISEPKKRQYWKSEVMFSGKDRRGIRNGLKAGVLEYGKANQSAFPFVEAALRDSESEVNSILEEELDKALRNEGLL